MQAFILTIRVFSSTLNSPMLMKKIYKKRTALSVSKNKHHKKPIITTYNRGSFGAGTAYMVLGMLLLIAGGTVMIGNIVPNLKPAADGPAVIISPPQVNPSQSTLQMINFSGVTLTPTPMPTMYIEPDEKVVEPPYTSS